MIQIVKDTCRFELTQLFRQPIMWALLFVFLATGGYSLYNGRNFVDRQLAGLDSLERNQQKHLKELIDRFYTDTTTAKGKALAQQAGIPQVVEFRAPPIATNPPHMAALMAIGQRDMLPYYDVINSKRDIFTPANTEIANPEKLASGNFDLSFVLLYLFPLLIVVLCYDIYSAEQEQQTDLLLVVQGAVIWHIIFSRLIFRVLLVLGLSILLSVVGFLLTPTGIEVSYGDMLCWIFVTFTYLLFWFSVCWLIILCRWSSRNNIFSLLGIWLTLTFMLPALANKIVDVILPMPSRTELSSDQRKVMAETWEMTPARLIKLFYKNNPKYHSLQNIMDTAKYSNKRFVAYYDLLGRRMDNNIKTYNQSVNAHNRTLDRMAWFNPVAQCHHLLNATAFTGMEDYLFYQNEVNHFQHQWVDFMNNLLLKNQKLSVQDVKNLPGFRPKGDNRKILRILIDSSTIWMAIFIIVGFAFFLKTLNHQNY